MSEVTGQMFLEFARRINSFYYDVSGIPLIYSSIHFVIAASISIYVFPIQYAKENSKANFYDGIVSILSLEKQHKIKLVKVALYSGILTGILASVLIAIENNKVSIVTAVVYGLAGPNLLIQYALKMVKQDLNSDVERTIKNIDDKSYDQRLSEIDKEIENQAGNESEGSGGKR